MPRYVKFLVLSVSAASLLAQAPRRAGTARAGFPYAIVYTRLPAGSAAGAHLAPGGTLHAGYGEGGRLVLRERGGAERVLTEAFQSAADPEISFDGKRVLFAAKRSPEDRWNIYEMNADGTGVRQVTHDAGDCRSPVYASAIFYLNDPAPVYQIAFVSDLSGEYSEYSGTRATSLYTVRLDGTALRRLTYTGSSSFDPTMLPDGRLLFAGWTGRAAQPVVELFGVHHDGVDYAAFSRLQGARLKAMPVVTAKRLAVFVEPDENAWDGAGALASISLRRNLKSYRRLTTPAQGLFHSPSALPDGAVLVSRRMPGGTHGVYRFDPATEKLAPVFHHANAHAIQAHAVVAREEPDGHSSVVDDSATWSKLYCLSVYESDLGRDVFRPGMAKRLRVLEGVPATGGKPDTLSHTLQRRFLGEIDLEEDGSFQIEMPPNLPIQLQILDENGMSMRSTAWIWAKNKEQRGCIGCHEDGERTPENVLVKALLHPAPKLTLPPGRRRTIDFTRDVAPIVRAKCVECHRGTADADLSGDAHAMYRSLWTLVTPGRARTSRLIWALFGRNTSRPWDGEAKSVAPERMPPAGTQQLTDDEKRTIVEWIDLGAHFEALPAGATAGGER